MNIQKTYDVLQQSMDSVLRGSGVSGTQYNVLRILRGAEPVGLKCSEIGERMLTRDPDITRLLDRLEKAGLISRVRQERDRRVVLTRITEAGLAVLQRLDQPVEDAAHRLLGHMGKERLAQLIELLEAVRDSEADSPAPTTHFPTNS